MIIINNIIIILKGFVFGLANIIPGVSGGTIAVVLGIYERMIDILSNLKVKFKENIKFIIFLFIGMIISIGLCSNIISYCLNKFPFATVLFFLGLIMGGIKPIFKKIKGKINFKGIMIFLVAFISILAVMYVIPKSDSKSLGVLNLSHIIILFIMGLMGAMSITLPGISSSVILMLIGYYEPVINAVGQLAKLENTMHNLLILLIFVGGTIIGVLTISKLVKKILIKYEVYAYIGIIGFIFASSISLFITVLTGPHGTYQLIIGIILLIIGFYLSKILSAKE